VTLRPRRLSRGRPRPMGAVAIFLDCPRSRRSSEASSKPHSDYSLWRRGATQTIACGLAPPGTTPHSGPRPGPSACTPPPAGANLRPGFLAEGPPTSAPYFTKQRPTWENRAPSAPAVVVERAALRAQPALHYILRRARALPSRTPVREREGLGFLGPHPSARDFLGPAPDRKPVGSYRPLPRSDLAACLWHGKPLAPFVQHNNALTCLYPRAELRARPRSLRVFRRSSRRRTQGFG